MIRYDGNWKAKKRPLGFNAQLNFFNVHEHFLEIQPAIRFPTFFTFVVFSPLVSCLFEIHMYHNCAHFLLKL